MHISSFKYIRYKHAIYKSTNAYVDVHDVHMHAYLFGVDLKILGIMILWDRTRQTFSFILALQQ